MVDSFLELLLVLSDHHGARAVKLAFDTVVLLNDVDHVADALVINVVVHILDASGGLNEHTYELGGSSEVVSLGERLHRGRHEVKGLLEVVEADGGVNAVPV